VVGLTLLIVTVLFGIACNKQSLAKKNMSEQQETPKTEHAVLVYIKFSDDEFGQPEERESLYGLEDKIEPLVNSSGAGEFDGHEFGGGYGTLYMYGTNADKLSEVVIQAIRDSKPQKGSYVIKRYGNVGAKEERINL
jgi:hypothetical protein